MESMCLLVSLALLSAGAGELALGQDLAVTGLEFSGSSKSALDWNDAPDAHFHALYRGSLRTDRPGELDHRCYATLLATSAATDSERPLAGRAFYYIATGLYRSAASGDLILGPLDSPDGTPRQIPEASCAERVCVDGSAPPGGDGLSWATAYRAVSDAMVHPHTTSEPVEVWIKGDILDGNLLLQDRGARLRGAFLGTESVAWKRAFTTDPSRCEADLDASMLDWSVRSDFLLERIEMARGASYDPGGGTTGVTLRMTDTVLLRGSSVRMRGPTDYWGGQRLIMERSELQGGTLDIDIEGGDFFDVRIERSTLVGLNAPALKLRTNAGMIGSEGRFELLACDITAEDVGVHVSTRALMPDHDNVIRGWIASSIVHNCDLDGVYLETQHWCDEFYAPMIAEIDVVLQQNTIIDNHGAGVRIVASRSGTVPDTENFPAHARAWLYDNLVTQNWAYGVSESPDDEAAHITSDAHCIGNDIWGNGKHYWDDGMWDLTTIEEVNALAECHGNWSSNPDYVDRPGGDYHINASSPARDAALCLGPVLVPIDIDGHSRASDGSEDVGADEM